MNTENLTNSFVATTPEDSIHRLKNLVSVLERHKESDGVSTKLNGKSRDFNMKSWDCGTSACALGSYFLSDYFYDFRESCVKNPFLCGGGKTMTANEGFFIKKIGTLNPLVDFFHKASEHFNISLEDSLWLFYHHEYHNPNEIIPDQVIERVKSIIKKYEKEMT